MDLLTNTITENGLTETRPRYLALESHYAGTFLCNALGRGLYSETQLRDWAQRAGVELVWLRRSDDLSVFLR